MISIDRFHIFVLRINDVDDDELALSRYKDLRADWSKGRFIEYEQNHFVPCTEEWSLNQVLSNFD